MWELFKIPSSFPSLYISPTIYTVKSLCLPNFSNFELFVKYNCIQNYLAQISTSDKEYYNFKTVFFITVYTVQYSTVYNSDANCYVVKLLSQK